MAILRTGDGGAASFQRKRSERSRGCRRRLFGLFFCLLLAGCASGARTGAPFPPLVVEDWGGQPFRLPPAEEGPVWLDVWASWCRPCRTALPALVRRASEAGPPVRLLLLNIDEDRRRADEFLAEVLPDRRGVELLSDPGGPRIGQLGLPGMPTVFEIESGILRAVRVGYAP